MHRFRFVALAAVAVIGFASIASAADLPVKAPVYKAAPAVAYAAWTGCYLGGNVGYGWAPTKWNDNGIEYASYTADGVVGGGQIGCDYQSGPWVFGIQGMFDAAGMKGSSANLFLDPAGGVIDSTKISWFATLTGRVGYTVEPMTLLYVKGGVAWVHSKFTECCDPTVITTDAIGFLQSGVAGVTRTGWTIGAGLEHMFTPNWSAFLEYDYIGLGSDAVTFSPTNGATGPFIYHIDQNVHTVLVGLNYRFGGVGSR